MQIKPIIFNTEMVRVILLNNKTATRRVVKPQPILIDGFYELGQAGWSDNINTLHPVPGHSLWYKMPCHIDDILYVRETYCWCPCYDCGMSLEHGGCCQSDAIRVYSDTKGEHGCWCYRASCDDNEYPSEDTWHPSIHMPKKIARIFLKVKDVRIERIFHMNSEDIIKEGIVRLPFDDFRTLRNKFSALWDSTINKADFLKYRYQANPWVWVIEFERLDDIKNFHDAENYIKKQQKEN